MRGVFTQTRVLENIWQDRQAMTTKTGLGGGSTVTFIRDKKPIARSPDSAHLMTIPHGEDIHEIN
jgi:hypothetical protein